MNVKDKIRKLKKKIDDTKHHRLESDKHIAQGGYQPGYKYDYWLNWEYNDNKVEVECNDHTFIDCIRTAIEIYLELEEEERQYDGVGDSQSDDKGIKTVHISQLNNRRE